MQNDVTDKRRLIVRVDDAGSSWAANMGCLRACTDGIARSVEVMMPCTWTQHAAMVFNAHTEIDIGIHLTLTSEWDAVKWRPLTPAPSLTDAHGQFLPQLLARDGDNRPALQHHPWDIADVEAEFRAQIVLGKTMFAEATHVSAHMIRHFADFDPRLGVLIAALCAEFGLRDDPFGQGVPRFAGYPPQPRDAAQRTTAFVAQLAGLTPGTHIFIDHPAVPSQDLAALGHTGYEDVMEDRISCLHVLTDDAVKQAVADLGIDVISCADAAAD
ncbi:ChbG/HpnK family deacetylase [uncultured Tateyamaria sp.]|uniref:ChbG/HpnK family deacetylase n=1 Tax=Tateyamaria sp. 1078 TaxID=3417464 RepID=UPI0026260A17|nr:ChbG/HpnK family deacetylase [uncultured Tateyamaria sp.]